MSTVRTLLQEATAKLALSSDVFSKDTARLDAEILLSYILGANRTQLFIRMNEVVESEQVNHFNQLIERRLTSEPVAYIIGRKFFWHSEFIVTPDVLIPRPETECLVEAAVSEAVQWYRKHQRPISIIDLGTGSGCLGISIAQTLLEPERNDEFVPIKRLVLSDRSAKALAIARRNAELLLEERYGSMNVEYIESDWFEKIEGTFDLLVSNPPYIAAGDTRVYAGAKFEPQEALYSEQNGLADIRAILIDGKPHLHRDGMLMIEFGQGQGDEVRGLVFATAGTNHCDVALINDLNDQSRVVAVRYVND